MSKLVGTLAIMGPMDTGWCVWIFVNLTLIGLRFDCKSFSRRARYGKFYTLEKALAWNIFCDKERVISGNRNATTANVLTSLATRVPHYDDFCIGTSIRMRT